MVQGSRRKRSFPQPSRLERGAPVHFLLGFVRRLTAAGLSSHADIKAQSLENSPAWNAAPDRVSQQSATTRRNRKTTQDP
jgi:hypothetical protein